MAELVISDEEEGMEVLGTSNFNCGASLIVNGLVEKPGKIVLTRNPAMVNPSLISVSVRGWTDVKTEPLLNTTHKTLKET
jgi:hypothetical protein